MPFNGRGKRGKAVALPVRFFAKVDTTGGPDACWPWMARRKATGYGTFWIVRNGKGTVAIAHRIAWEIGGNVLPVWPMVLDHTCRNPACQNVRHLRVVHQVDNVGKYADRSKAIQRQRATCAAKRSARQPSLIDA